MDETMMRLYTAGECVMDLLYIKKHSNRSLTSQFKVVFLEKTPLLVDHLYIVSIYTHWDDPHT